MMKVCPACGEAFETQRPNQAKWCSSTCRARAWEMGKGDANPRPSVEKRSGAFSEHFKPSTRKALALLRARRDAGVSTADFLHAGVGSRYGARIAELRAAGFTVAQSRERPGSHRYFLTEEPRDVEASASADAAEASAYPPGAGSDAALFDSGPPEPVDAALADWDSEAARSPTTTKAAGLS